MVFVPFLTTKESNMRSICVTLIAILSLLLQACSVPYRIEAPAFGASPGTNDKSFLAALAHADAAQRELQSGNAAPYKAIWSQTEQVTLIGGFGGGVEKGWPSVSKRIDWVATQFSSGTNTIERLVTRSDGKLGYVVQIERIRFQVPGQTKESSRGFACHPIPR